MEHADKVPNDLEQLIVRARKTMISYKLQTLHLLPRSRTRPIFVPLANPIIVPMRPVSLQTFVKQYETDNRRLRRDNCKDIAVPLIKCQMLNLIASTLELAQTRALLIRSVVITTRHDPFVDMRHRSIQISQVF